MTSRIAVRDLVAQGRAYVDVFAASTFDRLDPGATSHAMNGSRGHVLARDVVLVVDDFEDARLLYAETLSEAGYEVATAVDGDEAIQLAAQLRPRLVLMDLSMPGTDGWEATQRIRSAFGDGEMAILAVSAVVGEEARAQALRAGCDGFVAKPCPPDVLLSVVRAYVHPAKTG